MQTICILLMSVTGLTEVEKDRALYRNEGQSLSLYPGAAFLLPQSKVWGQLSGSVMLTAPEKK